MTTSDFAEKLIDEPARLAALERYQVLDTDPEAAFDKITALVRSVLDAPMAAVTLIAEDRQWLKSKAGLDIAETPRCDSFCTHTVEKHAPLIVRDALEDPVFAGKPAVVGPPHIRSYLGIPLTTPDGYNIGALCALDTKVRDFNALQVEIMSNFAALVMDELELRMIARTDFLTGALTRRAMVARVDEALAAFAARAEPACLIFLDIDHFKSINDTFSHAAGDLVLSSVAQAIMNVMPANGTLGRMGGEEFVLLVTATEPEDGLAFAEDLRRLIAALRLPPLDGRTVTASFGIAPVRRSDRSAADWLGRADQLMYAAKQGGRNQCRLAPPGD